MTKVKTKPNTESKAIQIVRKIRANLNELTKGMSREELKEFYRKNADEFLQSNRNQTAKS